MTRQIAEVTLPGLLAMLMLLAHPLGAATCEPFIGLSCPPHGDPQSWIEILQVQVNGVVLSDPPCNPVARIHWNWGDGGENDSWFPALHSYATPGTYQLMVTAYDGMDNLLISDSCSLQVGLYTTGFEVFTLGPVNDQDSWCSGPQGSVSGFPGLDNCGDSSDGTIIDDGTGNKVLQITARSTWSDEVGRDLLLGSMERYLRVEMEILVTDGGAFWFMDNIFDGSNGSDSHFLSSDSASADAWSNAEPGIGGESFPLGTWHQVGIEVDQDSREITQIQFDGSWRQEDDSAGITTPGGHSRFFFRGNGPDSRLWIDNLSITEYDDSVPIFVDGFESGDTSIWSSATQ